MGRLDRILLLLVSGALLLSGCLPIALPVPVALPAPVPTATVAPLPTPSLLAEPLFTVVIDLDEPHDIGSGQLGIRYVSAFTGGAVTGAQLQARVLPGGENWYLVRSDQIAQLVIDGLLQTADGAPVAFRARAYANAPTVTLEQLYKAALLDPTNTCFRGVTFFASEDPAYAWLTEIETISIVHYDLYQLTIAVYAIE
jgi:hypothetical protein